MLEWRASTITDIKWRLSSHLLPHIGDERPRHACADPAPTGGACAPSQLSSKRPTISPSGQLDVAGAITRRAKGVVRVQLDWVDGSDGSIGLVERRAIVRAPGRWGVRSQLPPGILTQIANRCSTVQANVLFTGFQPLRLRVRCARSRRCRSLETPRGGGAGGGDPAG